MNKTQVKLDAIRKLLEMPSGNPEKSFEWKSFKLDDPPKGHFLCFCKSIGSYAVCYYEDGVIKVSWMGEAFFNEPFREYFWTPFPKVKETDDELPF